MEEMTYFVDDFFGYPQDGTPGVKTDDLAGVEMPLPGDERPATPAQKELTKQVITNSGADLKAPVLMILVAGVGLYLLAKV